MQSMCLCYGQTLLSHNQAQVYIRNSVNGSDDNCVPNKTATPRSGRPTQHQSSFTSNLDRVTMTTSPQGFWAVVDSIKNRPDDYLIASLVVIVASFVLLVAATIIVVVGKACLRPRHKATTSDEIAVMRQQITSLEARVTAARQMWSVLPEAIRQQLNWQDFVAAAMACQELSQSGQQV